MGQRAIAIDYGSRRTGIAIGDTESRMAAPFERFENLSEPELLTAIAALIQREGIQLIICGLPLNENGSAGPQAMLTEKFAVELEGRLRASPHFYNSETEIDRLLEALPLDQ